MLLRGLALPLALQATWGVWASGPERFHEHSESQGLLELGISALTQDKDGFIYVGTANGLFRYDGSRFFQIRFSGGVETPAILSLAPHPQGGVWVGTLDGLAWARGTEVRWATFQGTDSKLDIHSLALDAKGACWVPNRRGMFVERAPLHFELDPSTTGWHPRLSLAKAQPGGDIVVLDGDLNLHRRDRQGTWTHQACPEWRHQRPSCLSVDQRGRVWGLLAQQLWRSNGPGAAFSIQQGLLKGPISDEADFFPDAQGGLWIPATHGLLHLDDSGPHWIGHEQGLPITEFTLIFQDRSSNLWYGGQGLFRRIDKGWFKAYTPVHPIPGLMIQKVHLGQQSHRVFGGTQRGLFELKDGDLQLVPGTAGLRVYSLHEDRDGDLWISTKPEGFWRLKRGEREVKPVQGPPDIENAKLSEGPDGSVYLYDGTQAAYRLAQKGRRIAYERVDSPCPPGRETPTSEALAFDAQSRLWIGSYYGLHLRDGSTWRSFSTREGLRSDAIAQITPGPNGSLWVRYEQPVGISRVSFTEGRGFQVLEHLDAPGSLPSSNVLDMASHPMGDLWLLTNLGILRWTQGTTQLFNQADGLPPNTFKAGGLCLAPDRSLWIGAGPELITCTPGMPPAWIPPPTARISAFSTPSRTWLLPTEPSWGDLPTKEASLSFDFASVEPESLGNERFQIFLEGHEDTWRDTLQNSVHYSHLKAGTYTFHVRAARKGGPWGPSSSLSFRVLPPWYLTGWALGMAVAGFLLLLRGWMLFRLRRLLKQREALEGLVECRTLELNRANEALRELSLTDPLTGLHNRRFIQMAIERDLKKSLHHYHRGSRGNARRGDLHNPDLIFFLVDLDHFKQVNDRHGHAAGDLVLQQSAEVLCRAMRDTDSVIRWGGEEFLLVARDSNRQEGAHIAERIRHDMAVHPFSIANAQSISVTCSIGFSPFPCDPEHDLDEHSWEQVVDLADKCLYKIKHSGRNGWAGITQGQETPNLPWSLTQLEELVEQGRVQMARSTPTLDLPDPEEVI